MRKVAFLIVSKRLPGWLSTAVLVIFVLGIICLVLLLLPPLEASTRSPVSRVKSDMRSLAVALESYYLDTNSYPAATTDPARRAAWHSTSPLPTFMTYYPGGPYTLTTPVAYITDYMPDPFRYLNEDRTVAYYNWNDRFWILLSAGPDCVFNIDPLALPTPDPETGETQALMDALIPKTYDPTNGQVSAGDVWRVK